MFKQLIYIIFAYENKHYCIMGRFFIILSFICVSCQKDSIYTEEGDKVRDKDKANIECCNIDVEYETDYYGEMIFEY